MTLAQLVLLTEGERAATSNKRQPEQGSLSDLAALARLPVR